MALQAILQPSSTVTSNGNTSPAATLPTNTKGALFNVNVTEADGSGATMALSLQWLDPASNTWITLATLANITAPGNTTKIVYPGAATTICDALPSGYRWSWVLGGQNATFTFSIGVNYLN